MPKEGRRSPSGLIIPDSDDPRHYVRDGELVTIDGRVSLGYVAIMDDRVKRRRVVRSTMLMVVSPEEMEVAFFGSKGKQNPEPLDTQEGHSIRRIYINSEPSIIEVSVYTLRLERHSTSYGDKNVYVGVESANMFVDSGIVPIEIFNAQSIEDHLPHIGTPATDIYTALAV